MMDKITLKAFAKINLSLKVLGLRPDKYHAIESIMQSVSLHDVITIKKAQAGICLSSNSDAIPLGAGNTAYRAAQEVWAMVHALSQESLLKEVAEVALGVEIDINKQIPVGAGMAGGSADAAAVIVGMDKLFNLNLTAKRQREIAEKVGSDVMFCMVGGQAKVGGRGEEITIIPSTENKWVLLVNPGYEVSTKWAYAELDKMRATNPSVADNVNDFELMIIQHHPEVADIKAKMLELGADTAQMTGSGPTLFGLFNSKEKAEAALEEIIVIYPHTSIAVFEKHGIQAV